METKICSKCGINKYVYEFGWKRPNKLSSSCKACRKEYYKKYQKLSYANPDNALKFKARSAVRTAILTGKLVRPEECSLCESTRFISAHHEDYTQPLNVIWLCRKCHYEADMKLGLQPKKNLKVKRIGQYTNTSKLSLEQKQEIRTVWANTEVKWKQKVRFINEQTKKYGVSYAIIWFVLKD